MKWLSDLKIAIIEENIDEISKMIKTLPEFKDLDKAKEALSLVSEAINLANEKKEEMLKIMNKIRKTKEFLNY